MFRKCLISCAFFLVLNAVVGMDTADQQQSDQVKFSLIPSTAYDGFFKECKSYDGFKKQEIFIFFPANAPKITSDSRKLEEVLFDIIFKQYPDFTKEQFHVIGFNPYQDLDAMRAGSPQERAKALENIILYANHNPETKILALAGAGGRGTAETLAYLSEESFSLLGKGLPNLIIAGFSDVSGIGIQFNKLRFIHSPVACYTSDLKGIMQPNLNINLQQSIIPTLDIFLKNKGVYIGSLKVLNKPVIPSDLAIVTVVGGNASRVIERKLAPSANCSHVVLFEDIGESLSRIVEFVISFLDCGVFNSTNTAAFLFGSFISDGQSLLVGSKLDQFTDKINDLIQIKWKTKIPMIYCEQIGHGPENFPIPMRTAAVLEFLRNDAANLIISTNKVID